MTHIRWGEKYFTKSRIVLAEGNVSGSNLMKEMRCRKGTSYDNTPADGVVKRRKNKLVRIERYQPRGRTRT